MVRAGSARSWATIWATGYSNKPELDSGFEGLKNKEIEPYKLFGSQVGSANLAKSGETATTATSHIRVWRPSES